MPVEILNDTARKEFVISNRWVNSIFTGYGVIKQRIFRYIIEQIEVQECLWASIKGKRPQINGDYPIELDMSRIVHWNNYAQVRQALREMSEDDVSIYWNESYEGKIIPEHYKKGPLLIGFNPHPSIKGKVIVGIKRALAMKMIAVDLSKKTGRPSHFTKYDRETLGMWVQKDDSRPAGFTGSRCKYMQPLYWMICSYAENKSSGFDITMEELRMRLDVEEKYKGFADMNKYILKHLQAELQHFGKYCFNYTAHKTGKTVTKLTFKIFKNKTAFNFNDAWLKIQAALDGANNLHYYKKLKFEERDEFNYLLTGKFNLDEVFVKLKDVHQEIEKKKNTPGRVNNVFTYLRTSLHKKFPPG